MSSTEVVIASQIAPHTADSRSVLGRVWDRMRAWLAGGGSAQMLPAGAVNYGYWLGVDSSAALPPVTEQSVLGLPPFGRGVDLLASTVAGTELRAYRYDKGQQINVRLDPVPEVLRDPDPLTTPWGYRYAVVNDLILWGNHFAVLGEPNAEGWPRWLHPVDATTVELARNTNDGTLGWRIAGRFYSWGSVFHCSAGNRSGKLLGRGVVQQYVDSLSGFQATDRHGRRYFAGGGAPPAILKSSNPDLTQAQASRMKTRYRETVGSGAREPLVLPNTWEYVAVAGDAEKQQLVDARKWDASLTAMVLGIPPHLLGLPGASMTYQNIEQADIAFVRDSVSRWSDPFAAAVTKWLLPAGQTAKFDWSGRMRHDQKSRAEVFGLEIGSGLLDVEEGRRMLDRPSTPRRAIATDDDVVVDDGLITPEVAA